MYVHNIVIFSQILTKYIQYFKPIFSILRENNILVKLIKIFLAYPIRQLLGQKVISLILSISKEKLKTISNLKFSSKL